MNFCGIEPEFSWTILSANCAKSSSCFCDRPIICESLNFSFFSFFSWLAYHFRALEIGHLQPKLLDLLRREIQALERCKYVLREDLGLALLHGQIVGLLGDVMHERVGHVVDALDELARELGVRELLLEKLVNAG